MKYKFSNSEVGYISEDGKPQVFKVCDICGKEQKSNFGYEIEYAKHGSWAAYRRGLCGKCAKKIIPVLEDAMKRLHDAEAKARE